MTKQLTRNKAFGVIILAWMIFIPASLFYVTEPWPLNKIPQSAFEFCDMSIRANRFSKGCFGFLSGLGIVGFFYRPKSMARYLVAAIVLSAALTIFGLWEGTLSAWNGTLCKEWIAIKRASP